jgi:hypothetical protein
VEAHAFILEELAELQKMETSDTERAAHTKLRDALDSYWRVLTTLKQNQNVFDLDQLPPNLTIALDRLAAESEFMYKVVRGSTNEKAAKPSLTK